MGYNDLSKKVRLILVENPCKGYTFSLWKIAVLPLIYLERETWWTRWNFPERYVLPMLVKMRWAYLVKMHIPTIVMGSMMLV